MQTIDALMLEFDYDGAVMPFDDDRQFVRMRRPGGPLFVRRDRASRGRGARRDPPGRSQCRCGWPPAHRKGPHGLRLPWPRRRRAWQGFVAERLPALQALGWRNQIDTRFRPAPGADRSASATCASADAPTGRFSLDFGIEIDGARIPLLPILLPPARSRRHRRGADHRRRADHQPRRRPHPETSGRAHRAACWR